MKKILLALLVSFIGIFNVKAVVNQNIAIQDYTNLKGLYYDMAILNCYDLKVINNTVADNKKSDLASECINKFKGNGGVITNEEKLKEYYNAKSSLGYKLASAHNVRIIDGLNGNNTFDSKLKSAQAVLEAAAKQVDDVCEDCTYTYESQYKEIVTSTSTYFNSICEYLKAHQGIRSYIKMIINIVCYGALAAGIILGIMDFVKAIASHEDAALTKAFQSFMKRVIAIALIFLSNVFVTLILNVVQRNEYLDLARENATCVTDSLIKVK